MSLTCCSIFKITKSHWKPVETQSEPVTLGWYFLQVAAFVIWTTVWLGVGYVGNNPIKPLEPTLVTPESAQEETPYYGQSYMLTHYFWYAFVMVHNTINVQVAHVSR